MRVDQLKIDGNPNFPLNNGKSNSFMQAEIQQLYDPDRLKVITSMVKRSLYLK